MTEIHDPDARRIVELAREASSILPRIATPKAKPSEPSVSLEESLMAIQTCAGGLIFPFLAIAGLFGASMTRD